MGIFENYTRNNLEINGKTTPGLAVWVGVPEQKLEWLKVTGFALDGEAMRFKNNVLGSGEIHFKFWRIADLVQWLLTFHRQLSKPRPGRLATRLYVTHQYFADAGIQEVGTDSLQGPYFDLNEGGLFLVKWKFTEYRMPKQINIKPKEPIKAFEGDPQAATSVSNATALLQADTARINRALGDE
jgi:hypothetical protein